MEKLSQKRATNHHSSSNNEVIVDRTSISFSTKSLRSVSKEESTVKKFFSDLWQFIKCLFCSCCLRDRTVDKQDESTELPLPSIRRTQPKSILIKPVMLRDIQNLHVRAGLINDGEVQKILYDLIFSPENSFFQQGGRINACFMICALLNINVTELRRHLRALASEHSELKSLRLTLQGLQNIDSDKAGFEGEKLNQALRALTAEQRSNPEEFWSVFKNHMPYHENKFACKRLMYLSGIKDEVFEYPKPKRRHARGDLSGTADIQQNMQQSVKDDKVKQMQLTSNCKRANFGKLHPPAKELLKPVATQQNKDTNNDDYRVSYDVSFHKKDGINAAKVMFCFEKGSIVGNKIVGCNVLFNPSNKHLGQYAGGAENVIKSAVGSHTFDQQNKALLNDFPRSAVPDGYVGITDSGNLKQRGIEKIVHQVAPKLSEKTVSKQEKQQHTNDMLTAWRDGFILAVEHALTQPVRIATTCLGAGSFGWSPEDSLQLMMQAFQSLPQDTISKIAEIRVIDPLITGQGARGKCVGDAVPKALEKILDGYTTHKPMEKSRTLVGATAAGFHDLTSSFGSDAKGSFFSSEESFYGHSGEDDNISFEEKVPVRPVHTHKDCWSVFSSLKAIQDLDSGQQHSLQKLLQDKELDLKVLSQEEINSLEGSECIEMEPLNLFKPGKLLSYKTQSGVVQYLSVENFIGVAKEHNYMAFQCPTTSQKFGVVTGTMPPGKMVVRVDNNIKIPLGYDDGKTAEAIVINYDIDQCQRMFTPSNGLPAYMKNVGGMLQRRAYLPNTEEGREVLALLKVAFKRKLIFRVGRSTTSGEEHVLTWNDIHHKTSVSSTYGYPDSGYLQRVKEELAGFGITMESIEEEGVNADEVADQIKV